MDKNKCLSWFCGQIWRKLAVLWSCNIQCVNIRQPSSCQASSSSSSSCCRASCSRAASVRATGTRTIGPASAVWVRDWALSPTPSTQPRRSWFSRQTGSLLCPGPCILDSQSCTSWTWATITSAHWSRRVNRSTALVSLKLEKHETNAQCKECNYKSKEQNV